MTTTTSRNPLTLPHTVTFESTNVVTLILDQYPGWSLRRTVRGDGSIDWFCSKGNIKWAIHGQEQRDGSIEAEFMKWGKLDGVGHGWLYERVPQRGELIDLLEHLYKQFA